MKNIIIYVGNAHSSRIIDILKQLNFDINSDVVQDKNYECNISIPLDSFDFDSPYFDGDSDSDAEYNEYLRSLPKKLYPEFPHGFPHIWSNDMIDKYKQLRIEHVGDNKEMMISDDDFDFLKLLTEQTFLKS